MPKRSVSYRTGHKHIHQEDAFTKAVGKVYEYYTKSPLQAILTTVGAIGVVVLGTIFLVRILGGTQAAPPKEASLSLRTAQILLQQQNVKASEDSLRNLINRYPKTVPGKKAIYYLGQALYFEGRYPEAREQFAKFEKAYPNKKSFLLASALYGVANCYEEEGKLEEAAATYLDLTKKYPKSGLKPHALLGAGRCYILAKKYDKAQPLLEQITKDYPRREYPVIYAKAESQLGEIEALKNLF